MKYLALAVIFAIVQARSPVPRKAADKPARTASSAQSQTTPNKAPTSTSKAPINANAPKKNEDAHGSIRAEDTQKAVRIGELPSVTVTKDWTDRAYWVFSGLLAIVGGFQAWFLYRTLRAINRQANTMQRQTVATETAAIAAKDTAEAAKVSANATRKNIDILINKERPRVRVEIEPLNLVLLPASGISIHKVDYKVLCYGTTPAFIVESRVKAEVTDSLVPSPIAILPMLLPSMINPTVEGIKKTHGCIPNSSSNNQI